jgi:hypothetical protein
MNNQKRDAWDSQRPQPWIFPCLSSVLCRWYKGDASGGVKTLRRIHFTGVIIAAASILGFGSTSGALQAVLLLLSDFGLVLVCVPVLCDVRAVQLVDHVPPVEVLHSSSRRFLLRLGVCLILIWTPISFLAAFWILFTELVH